MTTGHKHRELRVHRHSLLTRLLKHPLIFSDDLERVDASPYPWGPIAGPDDAVPLMPDGQPAPQHLRWHTTPPGAWYLSLLSVLHRWTGLTLRIPDHEVDLTNEYVERIVQAMIAKHANWPGGSTDVDVHSIITTVVADTLLIATGALAVEDFEQPQADCWCGEAHPVGEWHDPTHGQIDRDLQDKARTMLGLEPGVSHRTHAAITPTELNLQRRRDRGEL